MRGLLLATLGVALMGALPARAQQPGDLPPDKIPRFEVTVLGGYRLEGSVGSETGNINLDLENHATYGLALDWRGDRTVDAEIQYSYTNSPTIESTLDPSASRSLDVAVHDVLFGFAGHFAGPESRVRPYLGLGLGFSIIDPSGNTQSLLRFAFSLSGGVKAYVSERFGLRLEIRWVPVYLYSIPTEGYDCNFGGLWCTQRGNARLLEQADLRLGASFRF